MIEIEACDVKNGLSALLDKVAQGEEIVITRRGKRVARLVPDTAGIDRTAASAAIRRIHERASLLNSLGFDWEALKADRDAGRP